MTDLQPIVIVAVLWGLFGGTHVALAARHDRFAARFGVRRFTLGFYAIAAVTFTLLVGYYADHRFDGPAGLALAGVPLARAVLMGVVGAGIVLLVAGLGAYPRLPTALFRQPLGRPRGIERITRHPVFAGFALVAAHALLATHLVGTAWFAGFVLLSCVGAWHQDRRALAARGPAYAEYLAATSAVPFARGLAGATDLPVASLVVGGLVAVALRLAHPHLLDAHGAYVAAAVVLGGGIAGVQAYRRSRRMAPGRRSS